MSISTKKSFQSFNYFIFCFFVSYFDEYFKNFLLSFLQQFFIKMHVKSWNFKILLQRKKFQVPECCQKILTSEVSFQIELSLPVISCC